MGLNHKLPSIRTLREMLVMFSPDFIGEGDARELGCLQALAYPLEYAENLMIANARSEEFPCASLWLRTM